MTRISQWAMRSACAIALALSMAAATGCASNAADPNPDKEWDRPPGYVPFSA